MQVMPQNLFFSSVKFILIDLIGDVFYFPIWWYSKGAKKAILYFYHKIVAAEMTLGVFIWTANLFKPMYGQTDWQSQIISFFMRFFQIIFRGFILLVWTILMSLLLVFWLLLPLIVVYKLVSIFI